MVKEIDYMEYATDGAAQAAYVTDGVAGEDLYITQATGGANASIGDVGGNEYRVGQSFQLPAIKTITKVIWKLGTVIGGPTGDHTLRIETDDGGEPSGILADVNATKTITPTASVENIFEFATPFELAASTTFWLVWRCANQAENARWNLIRAEGTDPYANGSMSYEVNGSWTNYPNDDMYFKIYTQSAVSLQDYSEDTIKEQGSYSLKAIAQETTSLNKKLTRSGASINLSDCPTVGIYVYASRTGTNLKATLHDSGSNEIEFNLIIAQANTWTLITKDISAVANADKDDIDQIVFEILNADAINTLYIDNLYALTVAAYPVARLNKNRVSGYHCFMDAHMRAERGGFSPLKLPDGTLF